MLNDKKNLRQHFRAKRRRVTAEERVRASQLLLNHIRVQPWYLHSHRFALYLAMIEEIDTQPLMECLWSAQKKCYLPKITAEDTLLFSAYTPHTALISNRFNILEPDADAPFCPLPDLEVIFMPLVAFDNKGHRLGMGAGFYDKTLANLSKQEKRPLLIGLAYECQYSDRLPHDEWDVCLDSVITEQNVYTFLKSN